MDLAGLGALGLVAAEWLALGRLSGVAFPTQTRAASWAGHPQVVSRAGQPHLVSWRTRMRSHGRLDIRAKLGTPTFAQAS